MKGILYPASNVIFAAQGDDPAAVPKAADPSTATNPLASSYGGWEAVENSSMALVEAANLLTIPGRTCARTAVLSRSTIRIGRSSSKGCATPG